MPIFIQPKSLMDLSENLIVHKLVETCQNLEKLKVLISQNMFAYMMNRFRQYWCQIPSHIRRSLLQKAMEDLYRQFPQVYLTCRSLSQTYLQVPLACMLRIFMDIDIRELCIQLCCYDDCYKKDIVLEILSNGCTIGLNSLEFIGRSRSKMNLQLFHRVVSSVTHLTNLELRFIACDDILKIIGEECHHLQTLDISDSPRISDRGIKNLLRYQNNDMDLNRIQLNIVTPWGAAENVFFKRWSTVVNFGDERNKIIDSAKLIKYCENRTKLCSTLRTLNISYTDVTVKGILRAFLNVFNLETLGDYCKLGQGIDLLYNCTIINPELQLIMVNLSRRSYEKMQIVSQVCKKLKKIVINDPLHTPLVLGVFSNVSKIHLNYIPQDIKWINTLYICLPVSQLQQLSLTFAPNDYTLTIDLAQLLFRLFRLKILIVYNIESTLQSNPSNIILRNLEKIQIDQIDSPKSLELLLKCTPSLEVLHVYTCRDLCHSNIINVIQAQENIYLKCLYINNLPGEYTRTILHLLDYYPEIINFGNVDNWGISKRDLGLLNVLAHIRNFKLEFHTSSHWYQSECFQQ